MLSRTQGLSAAGRIKSMKIFSDPIGNQPRDRPVLMSMPYEKKYMGKNLLKN